MTDATTPGGSFTAASGMTFADPSLVLYNWADGPRGDAVSITIPNSISAGDVLRLVIGGVVNPGAGTKTLS